MRNLTTRNNLLGAGLTGLIIAMYVWSLSGYYDPQYQKAADFKTLGHFFTAVTSSDDLIVQQATDPAFGYYYDGNADESVLPTYALAPAEETAAILEGYRETYNSIWFFPSDQPWYDPDHVPQTWLEHNMQQTAHVTIGAFDVFQFQPWDVDSEEYQENRAIAFEDVAILLDWQLDRIGDTLRLTLYWNPITQPDAPLSGFAHLVGPPQPDTGWTIWVQDDHAVAPLFGESGEVRRDVYQFALPESLPDAEWQINFGLYDPTSGERIPTGNTDHIVIDVDSALMTP